MIDDGLRRTFIHSTQVRQVLEQDIGRDVRINIWQPVAERGGGVGRIGRATRVTPFDEFGRRIYEMQSTDGPLSVVQGITQITPLYTKVEGLIGGPRPIVWDMRIATSSIPRETLEPHPDDGREAGRSRRPAASRAAVPAERALSRRRHGAGANHQGLSRAQGSASRRSASCGSSARG